MFGHGQIGLTAIGQLPISTPTGFQQEFILPPRRKGPAAALLSPACFLAPTEIITVSKWFQHLNLPVRIKPSLHASRQQFFATDTDPVVSFGWRGDLSNPSKLKRTIPAAHQQDLAWSPPFVTETIFEDKWHYAWSEPVRVKLGLSSRQQQFYTSGYLPEPENLLEGYLYPFSNPVRFRYLPAAHQQYFVTDTDPIVSFGWFDELVKPATLTRRSRYLEDQPTFIFVEPPVPQEDIPTLDVPGIHFVRHITTAAY